MKELIKLTKSQLRTALKDRNNDLVKTLVNTLYTLKSMKVIG